jgi:hypothetical protein
MVRLNPHQIVDFGQFRKQPTVHETVKELTADRFRQGNESQHRRFPQRMTLSPVLRD